MLHINLLIGEYSMKKAKVSAFILSAALLGIFGATSAMAKCGDAPTAKPVMKCGAGKCGMGMKMQAKEKMQQKEKTTMMKSGGAMKCGAGKCGGNMKMQPKEK